MNKTVAVAIALFLTVSPCLAQSKGQKANSPAASPVELGKFSGWTAYALQQGAARECYVVGSPQKSEPKDIQPGTSRRDATMLFIAHRPAQNVHNELFVQIGYGLKDKGDSAVEIVSQAGNRRFALFTKEKGAWLTNAAEEGQFVDAARKGREIKVHGVSARGTKTVDTYSLAGISAALDRIGQECK